MLEPIWIDATTINDAWHQLIFKIADQGRRYRIDRGSFAGQDRFEFDFILVRIAHPAEDMFPVFPPGMTLPPPSDRPSVEEYFANYLFSPNLAVDEQYTYGQRLSGALGVNQIQEVIRMYREEGPGTNQACMEVGMPSDILLPDPPCLRLVDTRIKDGALHFFVYFRSWDLWGGFPVNLGGLELLKQYMAAEIGVENGTLMAASKGLHIYDHCLRYVRLRRGEEC
jgi:thymidylate synthase